MELPSKTVLNTFCPWTWTKMSHCCYSIFKKEPENSFKACNVRLGMMRFKRINYGSHAVQPKHLYLKCKMTTLFYSVLLPSIWWQSTQNKINKSYTVLNSHCSQHSPPDWTTYELSCATLASSSSRSLCRAVCRWSLSSWVDWTTTWHNLHKTSLTESDLGKTKINNPWNGIKMDPPSNGTLHAQQRYWN
jgi:hypothetical protein